MTSEASPAPSALNLPQNLVDTSGNLVIKTGNVQIEVPQGKLEPKLNELKGVITSSGGKVDSISYSEGENWKSYYITVKVPPTSFDSLSEKFKAVGTVKSMNTNVDDVTLSWVDLDTRISNLQAERERLLALYNRSNEVKDIIAVEQELTRVQTNLEYAQAQKISMERQISLSTITITLREESPLVEGSLITISNIVGTFAGALAFGILLVAGAAGFIIPIGIVLAVVGFVALKVWKGYKKNKEAKEEAKDEKAKKK